ncbi:guanine nucleotide binding protein, alpha subunit [Sistotremastrum niveocremeum HHB9708]|uniref:Guanine nucleotide binding protein, alpha subunit n=1 Tax=Sistotremastrum niveocremeum HHB9708 TaxID=1314777 RepID=A0A164YNG8_9AGAM|nr:guanine nucleotide binding protein, alpha subunit [Sistotremastrum niveocremeum HHB9708]
MPTRTRARNDSDPFEEALRPPSDETPEQELIRKRKETEARRVNDAIQEEIDRTAASEKKLTTIKLLVLGQSESGKSTLVKNFRLKYSSREFRQENITWRSVIQLNVVHSILQILDALSTLTDRPSTSYSPISPPSPSSSFSTTDTLPHSRSNSNVQLTNEQRALKLRLSPLIQVDRLLRDRIGTEEDQELGGKFSEFVVRAGSAWKSAIHRQPGRQIGDENGSVDQISHLMSMCKNDMIQLWNDQVIRGLRVVRKLRLEERSGFFLDSLDRVCSVGYVPTDDDVIKARLRTLGVNETRFNVVYAPGLTTQWRVYDVGGIKSQRVYWASFFDDVDCIAFIVSIGAFNQYLEEDPEVNRLADSFDIWHKIVNAKLLAKVHLLVFLNKYDLLERKLASGIRFNKYITSYEGRSNDATSCTAYIKTKLHNQLSESKHEVQSFICHVTSLTNTTSSGHILAAVTELLVTKALSHTQLIN